MNEFSYESLINHGITDENKLMFEDLLMKTFKFMEFDFSNHILKIEYPITFDFMKIDDIKTGRVENFKMPISIDNSVIGYFSIDIYVNFKNPYSGAMDIIFNKNFVMDFNTFFSSHISQHLIKSIIFYYDFFPISKISCKIIYSVNNHLLNFNIDKNKYIKYSIIESINIKFHEKINWNFEIINGYKIMLYGLYISDRKSFDHLFPELRDSYTATTLIQIPDFYERIKMADMLLI